MDGVVIGVSAFPTVSPAAQGEHREAEKQWTEQTQRDLDDPADGYERLGGRLAQ